MDSPTDNTTDSPAPAERPREWTTTPIDEGIVRGAIDLEQTEHGVLPHRLPAWARASADGQLAMAEAQPSGVRLAFGTRASAIELDVLTTKLAYEGAPPRPDGLFDLVVDGRLADQATTTSGNQLLINMMTGAAELNPGPVSTLRFDDLGEEEKEVEIWLSFREKTELVALRTDAPVQEASESRPVWLHHGSSISHGSDAASPTATWPALAAAMGGVALTNLGLGGSALLDPIVASTMRDIPADIVSVKIGINLVNQGLMTLEGFGPAVHDFLDTIRDGHPDAPLLVVSATYCRIHEDTPGPSAPDFTNLGAGQLRFLASGDPADESGLTLERIRAELARIVAERAAEDPNIHYLDGLELYSAEDYAELPLPDELHPDAATHRRIGERFASQAFTTGPFAAVPATRVGSR